MKAGRRHRRHAVRVAAVATLIVMVFYVVAAIVLNLIVTNHLISTTDHRLTDRLNDARQQTLTLPGRRRAMVTPTWTMRRSSSGRSRLRAQ